MGNFFFIGSNPSKIEEALKGLHPSHRYLSKYCKLTFFKGTVSRKCLSVCCLFLHQIAPPGPIRGTLGRFQLLLNIHGDIRIWNCLWGVRYTAESIKRSTLWKVHCSFLRIVPFKSSGCLHLFCNGLPSVSYTAEWQLRSERCTAESPLNSVSVKFFFKYQCDSAVYFTPLFPIFFLSLQENSGPSIIASGTRSGVRGVQQNVYRSEQ